MIETNLPAGKTRGPQRVRKRAITGFGVALLFVLAFAIFFVLNFKTVVVSGPSMLDTLKDGQRVLVSKAYWLVGAIKKKDIIVIADGAAKTGYIIKRVYRMPGEELDYANYPENQRITEGEYRIPEGHVFVLGDNREQSEDSRRFGPVPLDKVLGKVVVLP